jgi:hypothetical protein
MSQNTRKLRYMAYLLRLWETNDNGRYVWRMSLESPTTGERQGFTSVADLCAHLKQETGNNEGESDLQP